MHIFREILLLKAFLKEKRSLDQTIGFVPTMGALHDGHLSLIKASKKENNLTICSIFINPTQFNSPSDLQKYPRTLEKDCHLLERAGCDVLFYPERGSMYLTEPIVRFNFGQLDKTMEGKFRPNHFSGVALVVSKLFHIVEPTTTYFGQKDWQQFTIIRQLVKDLNFNMELKSVATHRESDGLAMSSRNVLLASDQRTKANTLYLALNNARDLLKKGMNIQDVKAFVEQQIEKSAGIKLEYFEVADSENLSLLNSTEEAASPILCIAAFVGDVRLIDNMFL